MEISQIDFQQLRIKHLLYKSKVRSMLYGGTFDAAFFSTTGPVNVWFETVGNVRYAHLPEIAALKKLHTELNVATIALQSVYSSGNIELAHDGFRNIEQRSDEFLKILSELDNRLQKM